MLLFNYSTNLTHLSPGQCFAIRLTSVSEIDRLVVRKSFLMWGQDWTSWEKHPDVLSKFPHLC